MEDADNACVESRTPPHNVCPVYDTKQSHGEAIVLEPWGLSKLKVKLATVVEGDPKTPFLLATTLRCRGRRYFFSLDCYTLPVIHTLEY